MGTNDVRDTKPLSTPVLEQVDPQREDGLLALANVERSRVLVLALAKVSTSKDKHAKGTHNRPINVVEPTTNLKGTGYFFKFYGL